jgi:histone H3/H4
LHPILHSPFLVFLTHVQAAQPLEKKGQTAWILFVNDHREKVKAENPDLSCSEQSKVLSQIWQACDKETHQRYMDRAREDAKRYKAQCEATPLRAMKRERDDDDHPSTIAAAAAAAAALHSGSGSSRRSPAVSIEPLCPLGRVRRIIKLDPEVGNVTKEAIALVEKAMQLFLEDLAVKSWDACSSDSRRALKLQDITHCMHTMDEYYWCRNDWDKPAGL